jgi:hypothetical protein
MARPSVARLTPTPTPPCMRRARGPQVWAGHVVQRVRADVRGAVPAYLPAYPWGLPDFAHPGGGARESPPSGAPWLWLCMRRRGQRWESARFSRRASRRAPLLHNRIPCSVPAAMLDATHPLAALRTATRSARHVKAAVVVAWARASSPLLEWWLDCAVPGGVQRHMPDGELEAMQPCHPWAVPPLPLPPLALGAAQSRAG